MCTHGMSKSLVNARKILADCGIKRGSDFFTLDHSQVCRLLEWADTARYRKPKYANGSRARYYYAKLQREANRVPVSDALNSLYPDRKQHWG